MLTIRSEHKMLTAKSHLSMLSTMTYEVTPLQSKMLETR